MWTSAWMSVRYPTDLYGTYSKTHVVVQNTLLALLQTWDSVQEVWVVLVVPPTDGQVGIDIDQITTRLVVDVSTSVVDPTRSSLLVEPVESPWSSPTVVVSVTDIDVDLCVRLREHESRKGAYDCTEEVLEKTLSTVVETRGTVGKVGVVKRVESLANLDRSVNVDLSSAPSLTHQPVLTRSPQVWSFIHPRRPSTQQGVRSA